MKTFKYFLMAVVALVATSCVNDEEDLFSESAALRVNNYVETYTQLLESSENGWVMNFYPSHDAELGGVVYTVRFKDGTVAMRSQEAPEAGEAMSLYSVKGEQEVLLSFDTYTGMFHMYSEPLGSSMPSGYESDYEFCFKGVSADQDTIYLKGKRYMQPMTLVRLHEDGGAFITKIADMYNKVSMLPHPYAVINGSEKVDVDLSDGILSWVEFDATENENVAHSIPFLITLTGMHLQEPATIGGQTFQDCTYDESDRSLRAVGVDVVFPVVLPDDYTEYADFAGTYTLTSLNTRKNTIVLTPDGDGLYYTVTGMSDYFSVKAKFNAARGRLEFHSQKVGESDGLEVWMCAWDTSVGTLTWAEAACIDLVRNQEVEGRFDFTYNYDYDTTMKFDSFILWGISGGASAGQFTSWRFLGSNSNQLRRLNYIEKNN